jgi:hypothetical protein
MVNYIDSFKRPFLDTKKFLIGALLSIIPIVNLIAVGYYINSVKSVTKAKPSFKLPEWKNYGDLFILGVVSVVINLIYSLPALIFIGPTLIKVIAMRGAAIPTFGPGVMVGAILALVAAYITPVAVINYVQKNKFGDAFDFNLIFKKAFTQVYAVTWLVATVYAVVIAAILGLIPYVGGMVGSFIAGVTTFSLLGQAYYKAK